MASALYTDVKRKGNNSVFTRCTAYAALVHCIARDTLPGAAGEDCCTERESCMRSALNLPHAASQIVPACLVICGAWTSQCSAASVLRFRLCCM